MNTKDVIALADRTADAWSFDTYGQAEWRKAIRALAARGFEARAIEAILLAKLVAATFPAAGSDLAGACEGEQIADLIDLARAVANMTPSTYKTLIARAKALTAEIEGRAK